MTRESSAARHYAAAAGVLALRTADLSLASTRSGGTTMLLGQPPPTSSATLCGQAASIRSAKRRPAPSSPSDSRSLAW